MNHLEVCLLRLKRSVRWGPISLLAAIIGVCCGSVSADSVGLPPSRFYSLDDIADIIPGFRVGFDPLGRITVVQYNKLLVLNDDEWIDLIGDADQITYSFTQVAFSSDGDAYFASQGFWGKLEKSKNGKLYPVILSPSVRPEWTVATELEHILAVDGGVFFYNWNGFVFYDENSGRQLFRETRGLEQIFVFRGELYLSIFGSGVKKLKLNPLQLESTDPVPLDLKGLRNATDFGPDHILFSHSDGRFFLYDGTTIREWKTNLDSTDIGNVIDISCLAGGNFAVAVEGKGIFVISPDGTVIQTLTGSQYQRVKQVISGEPGIFWYSTDSGVGKVFYGSGVTIVDQRSGLQVRWPEVSRWEGGLLVASDGKIYESVHEGEAGNAVFHPIEGQPDALNLSVSAIGDYMFIGNSNGVVGKKFGGDFQTILSDMDVARVYAVDENLCYVIGSFEITVLRRRGDRWAECADRISGYGFPSVIHNICGSIWVELGLDRVVRISFRDGKLSARLFDAFPWTEPSWVNIGSVGKTAILNGKEDLHLYFDEETETFVEAPGLDELFRLCPFGVWRSIEDEDGTIWVSHIRGVSELKKTEGHYQFNLGAARIIREPTPILRLLGKGDLWVSSRRSLYHVGSTLDLEPEAALSPRLVSVMDARNGVEIKPLETNDLGIISYNSNTLSFRFFTGTYTHNSLSYHVEMRSPFSRWSIEKADSSLTIPNLKEGRYEMRVTLVNKKLPLGDPLILHFSIQPPWFRSLPAYLLYGIGLVLVAAILASVPVIYIRNRNRVLKVLVHERTRELEQTMIRLREEESNRAVHEERSRIANEIHDSVQQGLSGLGLILDSTLKYRLLPKQLKARLQRAKTILRYTHQEVKHAVWNIENPLLKDENLQAALKKIASLTNSSSTRIEVTSVGDSFTLPTTINHHLIRVVQESITNAIRHGKAHHIIVELEYTHNLLTMKIRDDGCGFDVEEVTKNPHQLGLRGMLNRSDRFRGEVSITSEINNGTCITIKVPAYNTPIQNEQSSTALRR